MNCPTGKLIYATPQSAHYAFGCLTRRTPKDRCRHTLKWAKGHNGVYRCELCGHHHIGHEVVR